MTASDNDNFPLSFGSQIGPVISFLMVFPEDMFHEVISLRDGVGFLPFPPRVQCFFESGLIRPLFICPREYCPLIT